jgi:hypothetical protein
MKSCVLVLVCALAACSSSTGRTDTSAASGGTGAISADGAAGQGGRAISGSGGAGGATSPNGGSGGAGGASSPNGGSGGSGATLVNPAPGSKFFVGANFWRIDWEGTGDFFLPNVDWKTVENPWQPQFLADLAPYKVLRFMDWNLANSDPNPHAVWGTRRQKTDKQTAEPIAYEWQIDPSSLSSWCLADWSEPGVGVRVRVSRRSAGWARR